jgi:hypothetical protein
MADFTSNKFLLWAEVTIPTTGDVFNFDILAFNHSYELNGIPTCTLAIPAGRDANATQDVATIHLAISQLQIQAKVSVWCQATHLDDSIGPTPFGTWPECPFKVFQGYVIGLGWRRGTQQAQYTLHCLHWLVDLNFSSCISANTTPTTPNEWYFPAGFGGNGAGQVAGTHFVGSTLPFEFFNPAEVVLDDLWAAGNPVGSKGILGFYSKLAKQNRFNYNLLAVAAAGVGDNPLPDGGPQENGEALRAFALFEPLNGGYNFGVPLTFDRTAWGVWSTLAPDNIVTHLSREGMNASTSTIWDILTGRLHADFMYAVVPLVDKALIVPFTPGLSSMYHRTIYVDDYYSAELHADMPRPLRSVIVACQRGSIYGQSTATIAGVGGIFDNPINKDGLILFKSGPAWLTSMKGDAHAAKVTPYVNTVRTVASPAAGVDSDQPAPAVIVADAKAIWNGFAQCLYVYEVLKNRQGVITGPVRFDIAPGSIVRVEAAEDCFVNDVIGTTNTFYRAAVLRVTTQIDSVSQQASTTLHLAHLRTEAENASPAYSVQRHPFYTKRWAGCALIDDPAFAGREKLLSTHD